MIGPNWNAFKAKFSANPQKNFEWFCYLLFCNEFDKTVGIFRYKNQSAIETNPVEKGGEVIGWQAKFYETALTSHKDDIMGTIKKAKRDYPNISKIIFYTNQEWGQTRGKEPQGKIAIEKKARELGLALDWRTAGFFESPFVADRNETISRHFFSLDRSILNLIQEQERHSENILNEIQSCITFDGQSIEIDRTDDLEKLKDGRQQVLILSGVGGVGKTALIKKLYEQLEGKVPLYIFKATEFELRNMNDLFSGPNVQEFLEAHKEEKDKIIVIDSAEKLLDLRNTDPLKEFFSVLIKDKWRLIFTARNNYLEDLNYQFFEIYKIAPFNINIQNLDQEELNKIACRYHFSLPEDERLCELIRNPFYLNEYLKFYKDGEEASYIIFKKKLWNKIIKKSKPEREQCFLKTAFERANDGHFFINPESDQQILNELTNDGILGYESPHGYFITHDIYEEWALEKIVENEYARGADNRDFLGRIGSSLPMRRALRSWVSEKLLLEDEGINTFIEGIIDDREVESFWKDEILISILLSRYSSRFFGTFKRELLADGQELLKRLTFLLRIACKEVDTEIFTQLGLKNLNLFSLKYVLTKPKGNGWKSLIKFVFENLKEIGIKNIHFVLPIIHDWNGKFKEGETTRLSGLIALQYYQWLIAEDVYLSRDDTKDHLLQTILYGAFEIKDELERILARILEHKWKRHRDPYYDLSHMILRGFEGMGVCQILPAYILKLADLFWTRIPTKDDNWYDASIGVERYFGLDDDHLEYFPASSYQTPIYWLLGFSLKETIDFILQFTNRAVELFAKSDFAKHEVEEVEVFLEGGKHIKQYICNRLWCTYRGTQVSPHVLESIHMALEKFFLERGKDTGPEVLEYWLLYLLENSKSASISSVVASVVIAFPEKTFNVAKVLFKTKEFFLYDTARLVLDQGQKGSLIGLRNSFGVIPKNEIHEDERMKACDDEHRKMSLEHLFLHYQFFKSEETSKEQADKRQQVLWDILGNYYKELPDEAEETEADKTWRLYLARMDRRKMKPTTERTDDGVIIQLNPEIPPRLKEYSERSLKASSEPMKYSALKLWAAYKMRNDAKYKEFPQYENNPKLAFREVKKIVSRLRRSKKPEPLSIHTSREESFYLLNHSIPADVCSVLVRDHLKELSEKEKKLCKKVILEAATSSFSPNYQYQIADGVESSISVLPFLMKEFPEDEDKIKGILLLALFNPHPIGMYGEFSRYSLKAIVRYLWKESFDDAQSLLFGYLFLKPKYEALRERLRKEAFTRNIYQIHENEVIEKFLEENEGDLQKVLDNRISLDEMGDIGDLDLGVLRTAFLMIPSGTDDKDHKEIVKKISTAFAGKLLSNDREEKVDYRVQHEFLQKLSDFVLGSQKDEMRVYLEPFLEGFGAYESIADLFKEFISAEDYAGSYENFWGVWEFFEEKIVGLCEKGDGYWYVDRIVMSYLFAENPWKETATEWHTFKDENRTFFKRMSERIGHCPSALYAISKLLNDIGSSYLNDGVYWISSMLRNNGNLWDAKLKRNTIYYLENLCRKYIYENREKIRKKRRLREDILVILNFLVEKGSVVGYMLREKIL